MEETKRKSKTLETICMMGNDVKRKVPELFRDMGKGYSKACKVGIEAIKRSPRNLKNFSIDFSKSYAHGQVMTTANAYSSAAMKKLRTEGFGAEILGSLASATQDSLTILGAGLYLAGMDNTYTKAAAIVAGAKVVSNISTGLFKWYTSARNRGQ